jgi:hypothetical protein
MEWVALFNIIAPHLFAAIGSARRENPEASYRDALIKAGIKLDPEQARLLEEMEQAIRDGAVPR